MLHTRPRMILYAPQKKPHMFTGIVEGVGIVKSISKDTDARSAARMTVDLGDHSKGLKVGQSVALNGVCLTATKLAQNLCDFEMIRETLEHTNMGELGQGSAINVERSLKASDRLEGHFVLGHIDGTGTITRIEERAEEVLVEFQLPDDLVAGVVKKGSIAVDGISLTVTDVQDTAVSVCMIPHTIKVTNFAARCVGDRVNIETDILGKYILGRNASRDNNLQN